MKMFELFSNEKFIDPFDLDSPPPRLLNFATGIEKSLEVEESIINIHHKGLKTLHEFVQDKLSSLDGNQPRKISLLPCRD